MANVINRTPDATFLTYEYKRKVHTPNFPTGTWLRNPNLSSVSGVPEKHWKVVADTVVEMTQNEKDAVDAAITAATEAALDAAAVENAIVPSAHTVSPEIQALIENSPVWTDSVSGLFGPINLMQALVNRRELIGDTANVVGGYAGCTNNRVSNLEALLVKGSWQDVNIREARYSKPNSLLIYYGGPNAFNSAQNGWNNELIAQEMSKYGMVVLGDTIPDVLESGTHTGSDGASTLVDSSKSWTTNQWQYHQIFNTDDGSNGQATASDGTSITATLSSGTENDWDNGDAYAVRHPDYFNAQTIIDRIKELNPACKIFGYVSVNQSLSDFETQADNWDALGVHGIFMDEAGYDFGSVATNGRAAFNAKVGYVHALTDASLCFVNSWNMDHIIGTANDTSYPNTTYNSGLVASTLAYTDYYLLESFAINTTSYSGTGGYEGKAQWFSRGEKAIAHRATYGINLVGSGIVNEANDRGQELVDFGFVSAMMYSLEAFGISDTSYGSGTSRCPWWERPDVSDMGIVPWKYPGVEEDGGDLDVYWRFVQAGKFMLDFSSGAQLYNIDRYEADPDDPENFWEIKEHFTGQYLDNIWLPANSGTNSTITKKTGSPCAQVIRAGDAVDRYATLTNSYQTIYAGQNPVVKAGLKLNHTSDAVFFMGLWDTNSDKVEFYADTTAGYWVARNTSGGTTTTTTTSVALDTDWHRFKIEITPARILFWIDGSLVAAHSANITTEEMYFRVQAYTTAGTAVREICIDYMHVRGKVDY